MKRITLVAVLIAGLAWSGQALVAFCGFYVAKADTTIFNNASQVAIARDGDRTVGMARLLSDGVCNAYLVDIWTYTPYRRRGVARTMIESLLKTVPGQHVYTFTDDVPDFYKRLGFTERPTGLEKVIGKWLVNQPSSSHE